MKQSRGGGVESDAPDLDRMPSGPRYVPVPGLTDYDGNADTEPDEPDDEPDDDPGSVQSLADGDGDATPSTAQAAARLSASEVTPPGSAPPAPPVADEAETPDGGAPIRAVPPSANTSPAAPSASIDATAPDDPRGTRNAERGTTTAPAPETKKVVQTAKDAAGERTRELVEIVTRYGKRHIPEATPKQAVASAPPKLVGRLAQILPFMQAIPIVLVIAFVASFAWDFPGAEVVLFGRALSVEGILRTLAVSGLIGYLTNWLAITMLFQPREKRAIIPQGLIPAQRERVIYQLAQAISKELINADIIKARIQESGVIGRYRDLALGVVRGVVEDPGFRAELKDLAQGYATDVLGSEAVRRELGKLAAEKVEQQAGQGLGGVALRLYRTFAEDDFQRRIDRALSELPESVTPLLDRIDSALDGVPARVEARADEIEDAATRAVLSFVEGFDVQAMILDKARGFDESQLENLLKSTSNEQLNYIKYLGGILGVLGGFVIWQPLLALGAFVTVGLALWGIDEALVRARR